MTRTLKSLLVPTDFSPGARRAVLRAARLPLARGGRLHLVHVMPVTARAHPKMRQQASRRLETEAVAIVKATRKAGVAPPAIDTRLLWGKPYIEIIRQARMVDAELIVLGRKGENARMVKDLGKTAARVILTGEIPVLAVERKPRGPYRRPLIALPLDRSARRLITLVKDITDESVERILALRTYHLPFTGFIESGTEREPTDYHKAVKARAAAELRDELKAYGPVGAGLEPRLRPGDPRSVILRESRRAHADLIALGTHARSGLVHALLGSVAETVLIGTHTDVLVARPARFSFKLP